MAIANKIYSRDALLFFPVIFYTPFFFALIIPQWFRVVSFLLLSAYLFFSNKHYSKHDVRIFFTFILLILCMIFSTRSDLDDLLHIGGKCQILFFAWSLKRYLTVKEMQSRVLGLYVSFFYLVVIFSILSDFYLVTLGEFDIFRLKSDIYGYLATPFGVLFEKYFYSVKVYRSFFYFDEPIFVAVFYAFNVVVLSPLIKNRGGLFAACNFLGGIISMSMTFYVMLFFLYVLKKIKSPIYVIASIISAGIVWWIVQEFNFLTFSSYEDRTERFLIFLNYYMENSSILSVFFGNGVHSSTQFYKAFNSGLTILIFEVGIIGFLLNLILLIELSSSLTIFIFFILTAFFVAPLDMPIFWIAVLLSSQLLKKTRQVNAKSFQRSSLAF